MLPNTRTSLLTQDFNVPVNPPPSVTQRGQAAVWRRTQRSLVSQQPLFGHAGPPMTKISGMSASRLVRAAELTSSSELPRMSLL